MLAAPAGLSAVPDTSAWKCERCPFADGHRTEVEAGSSYVSEAAASFGDATGYEDDGAYAGLEGAGLHATGEHRLGWLVEDLGLDSRVVEIAGARAGTFDYDLSYRQLPRHRYDTTRTVFRRGPDNQLILPSNWTPAGTTSGFTGLEAGLVSQDIESERRTLALGGRYRPSARLRLFADYRRQEHDGTRVQGGAYFTNSSLLPRHFDYQTDQVDAGLRYDSKRGHLQLAYYGSFFDSRYDAVRWQNPFATAPGAEQAALAESPDNDFQQLVLSGGYRITRFDTRLSFSAGLGRGQQDQDLLPYTTNAGLAAPPPPAAALDAEVDTSHLALTITARPLAQARVKFAVRRDERDNQTPRFAWTRVIADNFVSGESELNTPYGFERLRMNLSADYELPLSIRLSAGYDFTDLDRDFQEVAEQTEDSGWARVQWQPNDHLDLSARGGIARREIDGYDTLVATGLEQNPLLRKYNLAYRYREFGEFSAAVSPPGWPVTIGVQASYADDSYSSSPLGLTDSEEWRLAMDVGWAVSERASAYLAAGFDEIDARQSGSGAFATPDWRARHADEFLSIAGGFRIAGIAEKMDLQVDYARAEGTTRIDVLGGAGPVQFPDLESTLDTLRARLTYRWSANLATSLDLRYENFPTEDWALEGVAPDTLPTILTLGARPYDDEVWMAGISFRYRIGGDSDD